MGQGSSSSYRSGRGYAFDAVRVADRDPDVVEVRAARIPVDDGAELPLSASRKFGQDIGRRSVELKEARRVGGGGNGTEESASGFSGIGSPRDHVGRSAADVIGASMD
jgi:hypothetical protein